MLTKIDTDKLQQHTVILQSELKEIKLLQDALRAAMDIEYDPQIIANLRNQQNAAVGIQHRIENRIDWIEQTVTSISNSVKKAEGSLSDALQWIKSI